VDTAYHTAVGPHGALPANQVNRTCKQKEKSSLDTTENRASLA